MKQTIIFLVSFLGLVSFTSFSGPCLNSIPNENYKHRENITIILKWQMPEDLDEISGICWVDEEGIACVQDNEGTIFIYNLSSGKVENQIHFADSGDFEAITKKGDRFYVVHAEGFIFEIHTSLKDTVVKQYPISISETNDIEGLCFDGNKNRLLVVNRRPDPQSPTKLNIFGFNLSTKKIIDRPVYEIDISDIVIKKENDNEKIEAFLPSDIAIHPITSDIYLSDGINSTILIIDSKGKFKNFIRLDKNDFPKPEGLSFSSKGDIFISSEGKEQNGFIAKIKIENGMD